MPDVGASGASLTRLGSGEVVRYRSRRHLIVLVVPIFLGLLAAILLESTTCPLLIAGMILVTGLVLIGDWWTTEFTLTNFRLIKARTPVWQRIESVPLPSIAQVTLATDLLGRVLDYGDVVIDTAATRSGRLVLDFVPHPETWHAQIIEAMAEADTR